MSVFNENRQTEEVGGGGGSKNFFIMFRINYMDLSKYQKVELKARNNPLQAFKTDLY